MTTNPWIIFPIDSAKPCGNFLATITEEAGCDEKLDEVLPQVLIWQWVLSVPYPIGFLFASNPEALGKALGVVSGCIGGFLLAKTGLTRAQGQCGAMTLIQRFGSVLNLSVHFHRLIPDGASFGTPWSVGAGYRE